MQKKMKVIAANRSRILALILTVIMVFGIAPIQVSANVDTLISDVAYDAGDFWTGLDNIPQNQFDRTDFEGMSVFDGEIIKDVSGISDADRQLIFSEIAASSITPAGPVGFEYGFDEDPDAIIEIAVQFVTPPAEVLRHTLSPRARVAPETEALKAHAAFREQLGGIPMPFSGNAPVIETVSEHHTLFNGVFMRVSASMVPIIASLPEVFVVTPDYEIFVPVVGVNEFGSSIDVQGTFPALNSDDYMAFAIEALGMNHIHEDLKFTGQGITVAVIDTGVDWNHPRIANNFDGGWDFIDNDAYPMETTFKDWEVSGQPMIDPVRGTTFFTSHGTHVAGTVLSIAPDARILAYRILGPHGRGTAGGSVRAIERAFDDGADVMNLSLGSNVNRPFDPQAYVANVASLSGVKIVISAGNSGALGKYSLSTPGVASLPTSVGAGTWGGFGARGYAAAITEGNPFEVTILGWRAGDVFGYNSINDDQALNKDAQGFYTYVNVGRGSAAEFAAAGNLAGRIAVVRRGYTTLADMVTSAADAGAGAILMINNQGNLRMGGVVVQGERDENSIPILTVKEIYSNMFSANSGRLRLNELSLNLPADKSMGAFSSQGPVMESFHIKPDIVAPGVNIVSSVPNFITNPDHSDEGGWENAYAMTSGTSMSAPVIAGVAAIMMQCFPDASPIEIKARMMNTATLEPLSDGNFSVYQVGAGFVDPLRALTQTPFATVNTNIPWLGYGDSFNPGAAQTWRKEPLSSLNFGVIDGFTSDSLIVEFSDNGQWDVEVIYGANNFSAKPDGVTLQYEHVDEGIEFTLVFDETAVLQDTYEGVVTFTNGEYEIVMPFAGFYGDGRPNPTPLAGGGILRPILTPRTETDWIVSPQHASFSAAVIGFTDPLGSALPLRLLAYPVHGEAVDEGHVFYYGQITISANNPLVVPRAVSAWGYNLVTETEEALPDGVWEFRFAPVVGEEQLESIPVGRFIVNSVEPELIMDEFNNQDSEDAHYPHVYTVVYEDGAEYIQLSGRIISQAHEMAIEHNIVTILYTRDGAPMVYGYEFAAFMFIDLRLGGFVNPDGTFTVDIPFANLEPYVRFGDARLPNGYAIEAFSDDFIRIPTASPTFNFELWERVGGIRSNFVTLIFALEEELMALAWTDDELVLGVDRFTPLFDLENPTDAFTFEYVDEDGTRGLVSPEGFTINRESSSISFTIPEFAGGIGQAALTSINPVIQEPTPGGIPQRFVTDEAETFTGSIEWYPVHNRFHFGTEYTATVTLWASGGAPFAPGVVVDVATGRTNDIAVRDDGLNMTFDVAFDGTQPAEEGNAIVFMQISDPLGNGSGPFQNFNDQAILFDSTATMVPLIERITAGLQPMPPNFWQMFDIQMPYYYWQNPLGGIATGDAALLLPAGLYDWLWTSHRTHNVLGYDSVMLEANKVYVFDVWVDFETMTFGTEVTSFDFDEKIHVDSARVRTDVIGNQGGSTVATFRGLMPNDEVAVFQDGVRVTEPWATSGLNVHGTPIRYDVTIDFPPNTTDVDVVYAVRMSDGNDGWFDTEAIVTVSNQYISRPSDVELTLYLLMDVTTQRYQLSIDSSATADGSLDPNDYDRFMPYFLEDNVRAVHGYGRHTISLPAGTYDLLLANFWSNRIFYSNTLDNLILEEGHSYEIQVANQRYALFVDGVPVPTERIAFDIEQPAPGNAPQREMAHHDAFTSTITWYPDHHEFQHDTEYQATIEITARPGQFLDGITDFVVPGSAGPVRNVSIGRETASFDVYFPSTDLEDIPGLVRVTLVTPPSDLLIRMYDVVGHQLVMNSKADVFPMPNSAINPANNNLFFGSVRNYDLWDTFMPENAREGGFVPLNGKRSIFVEPDHVFDIAVLARGSNNLWPHQASGTMDSSGWSFMSPAYGIIMDMSFELGYRYEIEILAGTQQQLVLRKFDLETGEQVPVPQPQPHPGHGDNPPPPPPPPVATAIEITPAAVSVEQGASANFNAKVLDQRGQPYEGDQAIEWSVRQIDDGVAIDPDTIINDGALTIAATQEVGDIEVVVAFADNAEVYDVAVVTVTQKEEEPDPDPGDGDATLTLEVPNDMFSNMVFGVLGITGYQILIDSTATTLPIDPVSYNNVRNYSLYDIIYPGGAETGASILVGQSVTFDLSAGIYDIAIVATGAGENHRPIYDDIDTALPGILYFILNDFVVMADQDYHMLPNPTDGTLRINGVIYTATNESLRDYDEVNELEQPQVFAISEGFKVISELPPKAVGEIIPPTVHVNNDDADNHGNTNEPILHDEYEEGNSGFAFINLQGDSNSGMLRVDPVVTTEGKVVTLYVTLHGKTLSTQITLQTLPPCCDLYPECTPCRECNVDCDSKCDPNNHRLPPPPVVEQPDSWDPPPPSPGVGQPKQPEVESEKVEPEIPLVPTPESVFDDVVVGDWFYDYANRVAELGLFKGTDYRIFSPNMNMTRAMFVQVLANINGVDLAAFLGNATFVDVLADAWYFTAVTWAADNAIVFGIDEYNFAPDTPITREQMAVMLHRFMLFIDLELPEAQTNNFTDRNAISHWALDAVNAITAAGIFIGRPDGSFDPQGIATRAEVAAVFARFMQLID